MAPSTDKDHLSWYVLEREPVSLIDNLLFIYSDGGGVDSVFSDSVTMVTYFVFHAGLAASLSCI